jgi:hypothetical protein
MLLAQTVNIIFRGGEPLEQVAGWEICALEGQMLHGLNDPV